MNAVASLFESLPLQTVLSERASARTDIAPRRLANAHIHLPPNFSAFDSVAQAVTLATQQNIAVLGASNYYDYTVYNNFAQQAKAEGVFPLFGLEIILWDDNLAQQGVKINDPGNPGKFYLCGKGITQFAPLTPEAQTLLDTIRERDSKRIAQMVARLTEVFGEAGVDTGLDEVAVKEKVVARHGVAQETVYLQERHVAEAFQEALFARVEETQRANILTLIFGTTVDATNAGAVQNGIRSHLMKAGKPAYVPETFVNFNHAFRLILALGGVPCYPTLADGANPLCGFEADPEQLVVELHARNIHTAEFIPVRNTPAMLSRYVTTLRQAGIVVTAGTEHNTRDLIPLAPTCLKGEPIPDAVQDIFWEGVCVFAAHQYLTALGEPGFVTTTGELNPAFSDTDARITYFARLGAEILTRYTGN